jgi:hypothetical protein
MSSLFADTSRFWVIFDTCTVPDYYLDVHKLLAIPRDATLRYNYREKYLSPSAITASLNPSTAPKLGLLFYAQRNGFRRGDGTPATGTIYNENEMLWIPTRIVEMLCIPARDGETFNYDFKVLTYPFIDRAAMTRVLHPLIQRREIPFNKWVTISSELGSLKDLQKGDDRKNWGSIVSEFHKPEFQFSSDVFWRLIGPTKGGTSKLVSPRYERIFESGDLRLVKAVYDLEEGQNHSFEIVSASPPRSEGRAMTQYSVKCTSTNDKNLEVTGSGIVSLRQQTADSVQFVGKIIEAIADHSAALRFETQPKPKDWPGGPELEVLIAIVKSRTKMVFGLIIGLLGVLFVAYGAKELTSSTQTGMTCLAIGACLLVISGLLIFKKLSLKS